MSPADNPTVTHPQDPTQDRKAQLFAQLERSQTLPALGLSIARVVQTASNDDEAISKLASFVLSDTGLTQRVLTLANSVYFRPSSSPAVTTISRAIVILGFETIKSCALALLLVEKLNSSQQSIQVRRELQCSMIASCIGREMIRLDRHPDAEEVVVVALFKNLGQLLVATYDFELHQEIKTLAQARNISENQAARSLLGMDYTDLANQMMTTWSLPAALIKTLAPLPAGKLKPPKTRRDWIQQTSAFSAAVAAATQIQNAEKRQQQLRGCQEQFGEALHLKNDQFTKLVEQAIKESRIMLRGAGITLPDTEDSAPDTASTTHTEAPPVIATANSPATPQANTPPNVATDLPLECLMSEAASNTPAPGTLLPSGKPENARQLLLASLQEVTQAFTSGKPTINQIVMMVLEALYRNMGFRMAMVCLRQPKPPLKMRPRIVLGLPTETLKDLGFDIQVKEDVFSLALTNDVDIMISDSTEPKIKNLLPEWHKRLLPDTRSFMILSLVVNKKPIGLFYADRTTTTPEGVSAEEIALIKSLKAQVLTVMRA